MRPIVISLLVLCVLALVGETPSRAQPAIPVPVLVDAGPPSAVVEPVALVTSDIATTPESAPVTAPAPVPPPTKGAGSLVGDVYNAVKGGQWRLAAAGVLALLMLALAKVREKSWSPFKGDRGGAVLVLLLALAGAFGTALASSAPIGLDLIVGALGTAVAAAGGYAIVRRLIWPKAAR